LPNWVIPENTAAEGFPARPLAHLGEPVLLEIALAVVLALAGISGFVLWIRRAAANARTIDPPAGPPDAPSFAAVSWPGMS
jgi:hypothetical protein